MRVFIDNKNNSHVSFFSYSHEEIRTETANKSIIEYLSRMNIGGS